MSELQNWIDAENAKTQAWIDAGPDRWAGFIPDESHWAEYGYTTPAEVERHYAIGTLSDLSKEAYGHRVRYDTDNMSDAEIDAELDSLHKIAEQRWNEDKLREQEAVKDFEDSITSTIAAGAGNRETAIQWLWDAEEDQYMTQGYFEYGLGVPYGYLDEWFKEHMLPILEEAA